MATARMTCPDCGRRGVYIKLGQDDGYKCRYTHLGCEFWAYTSGSMSMDIDGRRRLLEVNPGAAISVRGYCGYGDDD